jgi:hypothetical protein
MNRGNFTTPRRQAVAISLVIIISVLAPIFPAGAALVQCIATAMLCFFLDVTILRTISWESYINRNIVYGAVSTYLLLGFGCGFLFATIDLLHPGSFTQISPFQCGTFSAVPIGI